MKHRRSAYGAVFAAAILSMVGCTFGLNAFAGAPESASRVERFADPPASARMMPIWHHWPQGMDACRRGLDVLERRGFGGFVGNANFNNGYVGSDENMTNFVRLVSEAQRRGLRVWLYDEPGYPSGTAGGVVTSNHPERVASGYLFTSTNVPSGATAAIALPPGRFVAAAAWPLKDGRLVASRRRDVSAGAGDRKSVV